MQTPPPPPSAPIAPAAIPSLSVGVTQTGAGGATPAVVVETNGVLSTSSNVYTYNQLMARGEELSRQLESATDRRTGLSRDLRRAPESLQDGMRLQINELNGRIVQLERDIATNGQQLVVAKGLAGAATTTEISDANVPSWLPQSADMTAITVVFTLFVLCPIALSLSRLMWKRASRIGTTAPVSRESDLRMERVEQAVDAIAVEIERISEGQRFVTQLMTQHPALGQGEAQPVRIPVAEPVAAAWQQR